MNTHATTYPQPASFLNPASVTRYFWRINRSMTILFWLMIVTLVVSMLGMVLDPRTVLGQPTWAKPAKFSISIALYSATMLWMFGFDTLRPRLSRFILTASAWALFIEMVVIVLQSARGLSSHFNNATPLDAALWSVMGTTITLFWFVSALGVAVLAAQRLPSRAFAWSLRIGLIVALIGMLEGYLMPTPTPEQMTLLQAGRHADLIGAHTVGAPDGGPGLPLLGWSTQHGDLRIAHFVGLHAMQLIPLLGLFLMLRREPWLTEGHKLGLVWTAGLGYLGVVGLLTWQALRGQALIAPDGLTATAFIVLVSTVIGAAVAIVVHARSGTPSLLSVDVEG